MRLDLHHLGSQKSVTQFSTLIIWNV